MDWKKLLQELTEAGRTQVQIAEACGAAQSTVSELARGRIKSPSFELGTRLVALHAELIRPHPSGRPLIDVASVEAAAQAGA